MSRAQITLYLVMAILIIVTISLLFTQRETKNPLITPQIPSQVPSFTSFMDSCLNSRLPTSIEDFSLLGLPFHHITKESDTGPIMILSGKDPLPRIERFEEGLALLIKQDMQFCLENVESAQDQYKITYNPEQLDVKIQFSDETKATIFAQISIIQPSFTETVSEFVVTYPYTFIPVYQSVEEVYHAFLKDKTTIPTSTIAALPYDSFIQPYEQGVIITLATTADANRELNYSFALEVDR